MKTIFFFKGSRLENCYSCFPLTHLAPGGTDNAVVPRLLPPGCSSKALHRHGGCAELKVLALVFGKTVPLILRHEDYRGHYYCELLDHLLQLAHRNASTVVAVDDECLFAIVASCSSARCAP